MYINKEIKETSSVLKILLLIVPFFRPDFISSLYQGTYIDQFFILWRIGAFLTIVLLYCLRKIKIESDIILIVIFEAVLILSCYINHTQLGTRLTSVGNIIGITLIIKLYSNIAPKKLISACFYYFSLLVYINAICTIIYPNGLNHAANGDGRINFLGKDNTLTLIYLLTIVICIIYSNINRKTKKPLFVVSVVFINTMYYFSGSGMIAILLVYAYLLFFSSLKKINKLLNPITVMGTFLVLEVVLVLGKNLEVFSFIYKWLGKSATFSDRTYYWNTAIKQIMTSPVYGVGTGTVNLWDAGNYAHNAVLDVMMKGGILALAVWLLMIIHISRKMVFKENVIIKRTFLIVLLAYLLIGLMEGLEDRVAFNAFIALLSSVETLEKRGLLENRIFNYRKIRVVWRRVSC